MIFCSTSGSAAGMAATGEAASFAGAAIGSVFGGTTGAIGGASGSGVARMRQMGGRNEVLRAPSPTARYRRRFFSSMSETVSIAGFGAGFGVSADFDAGSTWAFGAGGG